MKSISISVCSPLQQGTGSCFGIPATVVIDYKDQTYSSSSRVDNSDIPVDFSVAENCSVLSVLHIQRSRCTLKIYNHSIFSLYMFINLKVSNIQLVKLQFKITLESRRC